MLIRETKSFCSRCGETHPARYEEREGKVVYVIGCPIGDVETVVSGDPALFRSIDALRDRSPGDDPPFPIGRLFHLLEITRACNMSCPICYADAGGEASDPMPLGTVRELGRRIRENGGRLVSLTGGEPTVHPDLPEIVRLLSRECKLKPVIATNGLKLARDLSYCRTLKQAGLHKIQLQFDTFDNETYRAMRGRSDVTEKLDVIENVRTAGLRCGFFTTACNLNIHELGAIVDLAVRLAPAVDTVAIQVLLPVGRLLGPATPVDREAILHAVANAGRLYEAAEKDFVSLPEYGPWRLAADPHCASHLFLCVDDGRGHPLQRDIDAEGLLERFQESTGRAGLLGSKILPLWYLVRSARRGRRFSLVRRLLNTARGKGSRCVVILSVMQYMTAETRDERRLARCASCFVEAGGFQTVCERSCRLTKERVVRVEAGVR